MGAIDLTAADAALRALLVPFGVSQLAWPDGPVLFLGARPGPELRSHVTDKLLCQQDLKPFADALEHAGLRVGAPAGDAVFELVLVLLPRQRDQRRLMLARAIGHVAPGGRVLVAVANAEGARSAQDDLGRLAGPLQQLSKHKCRVFWTTPDAAAVDAALQTEWLAMDALRPTVDGLLSRPGLFAWDRIDPASRLLAEHLPDDLAGHVADLGAGAGYLSVQVLRRCAQVHRIDLYEADARALPAAQVNLEAACVGRKPPPTFAVHWHDVAVGLDGPFDAIVSNPPFHQGHAGQPELGQAFIVAAAGALRTGGRLLMVANRHLPYEAVLCAHFAEVRPLLDRDGFKLIEARR